MCTNMRHIKYKSKHENRIVRTFENGTDFVHIRKNPIKDVLIKCGFCEECQREKTVEWANRLMLESLKHQDMCCLTLTYNDKHLPEELNHRDYQLFLKRLRKDLSKRGIKIYYFVSGEYGSEKGRPHYHMILFGFRPDDLVYLYTTDDGYKIYTSNYLESKWKCGWVSVNDLSFNSAFYTAKYLQKTNSVLFNEDKAKPFIACSTSITIGFDRKWFEKNGAKPVYYQNGYVKPMPRSLLLRAEKEGFDIAPALLARQDKIEKHFKDEFARQKANGHLNFIRDKKEFFKKGIDNL